MIVLSMTAMILLSYSISFVPDEDNTREMLGVMIAQYFGIVALFLDYIVAMILTHKKEVAA